MASERNSALFSKKQREWLQGESDIEPESGNERALRSKIREKLRGVFFDFNLIRGNLDPEDIEMAFEYSTLADALDALEGMTAALSIIYRMTRDGVRVGSSNMWHFETLLVRAIQNAEFDLDGPLDHSGQVGVTFENDEIVVEKEPLNETQIAYICEKVAAGETSDLSRRDLEWYLHFYDESGDLDPQTPLRQYQNYMEMAEDSGEE